MFSYTFRPPCRLRPLATTLVLLALVVLVSLTHAFPLRPTSPHKEKRSDLVCRAASWEDVVAFFVLNYIAHAATIRHFPGDSDATQFWYTLCALFVPFAGVWRACQSIAYARPFEKDPLERAKYAGALCLMETSGDTFLTELRGCRIIGKTPTKRDKDGFIHHCSLVDVDDGIDTRTVKKSTEKIHGASRELPFSVVPPNFIVTANCSTAHRVHLSTSNTLLKNATAVAQLLFACFTLYRTRGDQVENYGYAAFGFTVIPYAIMSLINLTANLLTPEYPTLFMVYSDRMEKEKIEFDGTVGTIVPKADTSENGRYDTLLFRGAHWKRGCCYGDVQIPQEYVGNSNGELRVEYSRWGRHRTIPSFEKSQRIRNYIAIAIGILAIVTPYVLISILSNGFQTGSISTPLQRGFVMSWLVFGQLFGAWFGFMGHDDSTEGSPFSTWDANHINIYGGILILILLAVVTPAVGGFVVVGLMIKQFGSCVLV